MKRFFTRLFLNDYVFCSIFVGALLWLMLTIFNFNHDLVDPFKEALSDFEVTDLAFTQLRTSEPPADTNIVIVNTGYLQQAELAVLVENLNQYGPAVMGFNMIPRLSEDFIGDSLLREALRKVPKLVFTSKLKDYDENTGQWKNLERPDSVFMKFEDSIGIKYAETGFKNMFTHDKDFKTTRLFFEKASVNGSQETFFPIRLVNAISPDKVEAFMKRERAYEIINYRGNLEKFITIDAEQALRGEFDASLIKGKILILGYLGESMANEKFWDDYKYYTPLNKKYAGKTFPDMFETVIYANITSQILHNEHINEVSPTTNLIINLLLCFLNVILFSMLFHAAAVWWDAFSIAITLLETIVILFASAFVFSQYHIDVNINFSIVFLLVLSTFLELYYGLLKIFIQKLTVKYRIMREDRQRQELNDLIGGKSKELLNDSLTNFDFDQIKKNEKNKEDKIDPNMFKL